MASHKEISKLVIDMNHTAGSGRPSGNSQGIHGTSSQPTMPTTLLPVTPVNIATAPNTPVTTPSARNTPLKETNQQLLTPQVPTHQCPCQPLHRTGTIR